MSDSSFSTVASLQGSIQSLYEVSNAARRRATLAEDRLAQIRNRLLDINVPTNGDSISVLNGTLESFASAVNDVLDILNDGTKIRIPQARISRIQVGAE